MPPERDVTLIGGSAAGATCAGTCTAAAGSTAVAGWVASKAEMMPQPAAVASAVTRVRLCFCLLDPIGWSYLTYSSGLVDNDSHSCIVCERVTTPVPIEIDGEDMKTATIARPVALAAGSALVAGFLLASPAQAADRDFVLTHGHVDGFEITYDPAENELVTQIKDDTRIYDATPQFRDPTQVTLAYQDEQAIGTLPAATGSWSFLGAHGGTEAWLASQSGGDQGYVPWVGWSTERLLNTLSGSGITPASGQPVSIDLDIDGPGDVFTFQNDSFGLPINRFVDTTNADPDRIRVTENAHVHTNWVFTAEGDYSVDATRRWPRSSTAPSPVPRSATTGSLAPPQVTTGRSSLVR